MMDFSDIELETRLDDLVELLDRDRPGPTFALPANQFHKVKAEDHAKRRGIKALIQPENARQILEHLPGIDDRTHCILRGDFVLCDLVPTIIAARGRSEHLHLATLGLSSANADALVRLRSLGLVDKITLVCSHYFAKVDRLTTFREVKARLGGIARIIVARSHAKVLCIPTASGDSFVIEGSANLRSSDNAEQMVIFNDRETLEFHRRWMEQLDPV